MRKGLLPFLLILTIAVQGCHAAITPAMPATSGAQTLSNHAPTLEAATSARYGMWASGEAYNANGSRFLFEICNRAIYHTEVPCTPDAQPLAITSLTVQTSLSGVTPCDLTYHVGICSASASVVNTLKNVSFSLATTVSPRGGETGLTQLNATIGSGTLDTMTIASTTLRSGTPALVRETLHAYSGGVSCGRIGYPSFNFQDRALAANLFIAGKCNHGTFAFSSNPVHRDIRVLVGSVHVIGVESLGTTAANDGTDIPYQLRTDSETLRLMRGTVSFVSLTPGVTLKFASGTIY